MPPQESWGGSLCSGMLAGTAGVTKRSAEIRGERNQFAYGSPTGVTGAGAAWHTVRQPV